MSELDELGELKETLSQLKKELEAQRQEFSEVKDERDRLKEFVERQNPSNAEAGEARELSDKIVSLSARQEEEEKDEDLDLLSNSELFRRQQREAQKLVNDALKPLQERVEGLQKRVGEEMARVDLRMTEARHPDMDLSDNLYRKSFIEVAKENPSWSAEQVYQQLAKDRKIAELEEKEQKEDQKRQELAAAAEKGGLPPSLAEKEQVSREEAADYAYAVAFGTEGEGAE